jgi:hypothetical protein
MYAQAYILYCSKIKKTLTPKREGELGVSLILTNNTNYFKPKI